ERGLHMVPAFHPWLVQGVASYGLELFRQLPDLDVVYVPVGMGSGVCATLAARDALGLATRVVGVGAADAPAYTPSFRERRAGEPGAPRPRSSRESSPLAHPPPPRLADGMACRVPDLAALEAMWAGVDHVVTVSE